MMTSLPRFAIAAAALALLAPAQAHAALGTPSTYTSAEAEDLVSIALDETTGSACVPPDPIYIPSFVREPNGKIVGVNYLIIEYEC